MVWDPGNMIQTKEKQKGFPPWWRRSPGSQPRRRVSEQDAALHQGCLHGKNEARRPLDAFEHPVGMCSRTIQRLGSPGSEAGCFF